MKLKQVLTIMVIIALVVYIAILHHRVDVAEKRFNYLNQNINILSEKIDTQNVKLTKVQFDNCAEGSEVKVGDKFEFNRYGVTVVRRGTVALLHGTLGYHIDKFKRCFVSFAERVFIIWDNNRMTNVEKVVV